MLARLRAITKRMIPQVQIFRTDALQWRWEVNLIQSEELNAFCMTGGKIAFYSGIIQKLALTDDEIAAIMGHEMAHALREHVRERASQQTLTNLGFSLLSSALKLNSGQNKLAQQIATITLTLPNSREHESEADRVGIELAACAGFDPKAAIKLWQKMEKAAGGRAPEFLSTHPSPETRQKDLAKLAETVEPLYQATQNP